MKNDLASVSSSPPTPPSPLPVSVGPGHEKYSFSPSPTPSPPFSPCSSQTSPENVRLLVRNPVQLPKEPSAFSLDRVRDELDFPNSRFKDCLEWLFLRCCRCAWPLHRRSTSKEELEEKMQFPL
eukprot:TRINITY_DN26837_c0_g1_i1.p1 TRINITY_DN26837_c0_g1~~TRINITY_DN26837_c0_g1_i1.p1  ORF type:complete len:124 (+),score=6.99 TRINITY_DN26837_c0_g1_i1:89-460(+)